jgi:phage terminase large subunit-like protein
MARPAKAVAGIDDAIRMLAQGLKTQATRTNIYGYKPHPKQELFHSAPAHMRGYIGGNRAGKTTAGVIEDLWWLTGTHPYRETPELPVRGRVVGVDFYHGVDQILIPEFKRWVIPSTLKGGSWERAYTKESRVLEFKNGSTVEFMSYEQDGPKFAGTSRHFIHYDEEPPKDIFIECEARLIDTNGSSWMSLTPLEGMTWVYDDIFLKSSEDGDVYVIEVDMFDNPHIKVEAANRFFDKLDTDEKSARQKGSFVKMGGLIFPDFHSNNSKYVIPHRTPPKTWQFYMSVDHGYNNPTCWLWHAVSPSNAVVTFHEHYAREMTIKEHAKVVKEICESYKMDLDDFYLIVGDPAMSQRNAVEGVNILEEYAKYGIYIMPGNNNVMTGINMMHTYLRDKEKTATPYWHITENCTMLIKEMSRLRWKSWSGKKAQFANNRQDLIHKKDDHAPDSARYFVICLPDLAPELESEKKTLARIPGARYDESLIAGSAWSVQETLGYDSYLDDSNIGSLEYD